MQTTQTLELEIWAEETHIKIKREDRSYRFLKTKGMGYLVELLEHPYRRISAMELANMEIIPEAQSQYFYSQNLNANLGLGLSLDSPQRYPRADGKTIQEVKTRLVALTQLEAELLSWCDLARLEDVRGEREALIAYLCEVLTATQKHQYFPDISSSQTRTVNRSLSRALKAIRDADAEVGIALRQDLRVWRDIIYTPERTSVRIVHCW